jgi:hypothetical protein
MLFTWTIKVRLNVGGYITPEVDITPALGLALIGLFFFGLLHDPSW